MDRSDIEIQLHNGEWINLQDYHDSINKQYPDWVNAIIKLAESEG